MLLFMQRVIMSTGMYHRASHVAFSILSDPSWLGLQFTQSNVCNINKQKTALISSLDRLVHAATHCI